MALAQSWRASCPGAGAHGHRRLRVDRPAAPSAQPPLPRSAAIMAAAPAIRCVVRPARPSRGRLGSPPDTHALVAGPTWTVGFAAHPQAMPSASRRVASAPGETATSAPDRAVATSVSTDAFELALRPARAPGPQRRSARSCRRVRLARASDSAKLAACSSVTLGGIGGSYGSTTASISDRARRGQRLVAGSRRSRPGPRS